MRLAIKNKTISPADARMIRIRQAIGNFFARFGGVYRKQSEERVKNLILKMAGVTKKELEGISKDECQKFIGEKFKEKFFKSPEAFVNNFADILVKDENSPFDQFFTDPRSVIKAFVQQNFEAIKKMMDPKAPVQKKGEDPMETAEFNLSILESKLKKAGCEKFDLSHEGSITVEEFARLLATKAEPKVDIKLIPGTKNGYIPRV